MNTGDPESELRPLLGQNETLIWSGKPRQGLAFRSTDIFLVPFSLAWCAFAVLWTAAVFASPAPLLFKLFGIPFVLIGLYITIGRFFVDAKKRANTSYGITTERILIQSGIFSKALKSLNIKTLSEISFRETSDRSGTISFGPVGFPYAIFQGFDWPGNRYPARLELIDDVKSVYNRIIELQRQK